MLGHIWKVKTRQTMRANWGGWDKGIIRGEKEQITKTGTKGEMSGDGTSASGSVQSWL